MFLGSLVSRVSLLHWFTKSSKCDVDFHNNELIWARFSPFHISAGATSLEVFVRRMESDRQLVNTNIWDLVLVLLKFNVLGKLFWRAPPPPPPSPFYFLLSYKWMEGWAFQNFKILSNRVVGGRGEKIKIWKKISNR